MKANQEPRIHDLMNTKDYQIIDAHCHIGSYYPIPVLYGDADDLVAGMDRVGVEKICISSCIGISNDFFEGNNMVAQAIKKYPDRLIGMASINANKKDSIEKELIRCFDELEMSMIKLHPNFSGCPMTCDNYEIVYEFASERKLAILNHSWQDYQLLDKLSEKYPDVRFIQAHTAGGWGGKSKDMFLEVARNKNNVFVDIASSIAYYGAFEKLVEYLGPDKIIFGSDYPLQSLEYQLGRVLYSDIGVKNKQKILGENMLKVFRFS